MDTELPEVSAFPPQIPIVLIDILSLERITGIEVIQVRHKAQLYLLA